MRRPARSDAVLTVTDDLGARSTLTQSVTVNEPEGPGAVFSKEVTGRNIRLDASGSSSPNGTVTGYVWDFGDGKSAEGARPATPLLPTARTRSRSW